MPKFSRRSLLKLETCHPDLVRLFNEVIKHEDCTILDGYRNKETQNQLFSEGRTKARYPKSNHNHFPSNAVDVMPYPIDWGDKDRIIRFAGFVEGVASQMGIKITWGGDFNGFFDGPHYELSKTSSQPRN